MEEKKLLRTLIKISCLIYMASLALSLSYAQNIDKKEIKKQVDETLNNIGKTQKKDINDLVKKSLANIKEYRKNHKSVAPTFDKNGKINLDALISKNFVNPQDSDKRNVSTLMTFVSLSMPEYMLKNIIKETIKSKGTVVLRGFVDGDIKKTALVLKKLFKSNKAFSGMLLDPRLFKTYNITQVPTFVVTKPILGECEGSFCIPVAPEYLKLSGAVHIEWALEQFISESSSLKSIAINHLNFYKENKND